jgi:hypothetical protein
MEVDAMCKLARIKAGGWCRETCTPVSRETADDFMN